MATNYVNWTETWPWLVTEERLVLLLSSLKENILLSTTAIHMESAEILRNKVNLQCIANGAHPCSNGRGFREQIKHLSVCQLQKQGQAFRISEPFLEQKIQNGNTRGHITWIYM